jgi:hypothetical protein
MVDRARTYQLPRARPVSEPSLDALLVRSDELARRWAIAMLGARPADEIGQLPLEALARDAPPLCAQAVRALQSDGELERLTGRGASGARGDSAAAWRLAAICGGRDAVALVEAAEALRGALWEALLGVVGDPSARVLAELADRLAYVCAALLAGALEGSPELADVGARDEREIAGAFESPARELASLSSASRRAVIVDERTLAVAKEPAPSALVTSPPEIEIRDQRREVGQAREEGPAAWLGPIGAQLERFERDGVPFAVLLVEPVELERVRREEPDEELQRLARGLEDALRAELATWSGSLTRERPGRCWLLVPGVEAPDAAALAQSLIAAVRSGASDRGAPLALAIGTAVCPEDGRRAAALAAHADVGLYASRAGARAPAARRAAPVDESG